jgi:Vacuolar sorting protein 9 (VPS9) domain
MSLLVLFIIIIMAFQEMVDSDIKELAEEAKKHRQSDMASGNSLIIKTESGLTDSVEQFLPSFQIELPFSLPTTEIFEIFSVSALKKRFQVIEKNSTMATAVYKERYNFKSILLCCLPAEQRNKNIISAVRLHININEILCKRIVTVKGIYGYPQVILPLIIDFQTRLESVQRIIKKKDAYTNLSNEEEDTVVTCKHESSSYYQFYKILSSEGYTLGKTISSFISAFAEQYRNPEESVAMLPIPLDSIKEIIEQAVEALFTHYNYGRANSEKLMMYCRPAVEKYIFSKVHSILFPIYTSKTISSNSEIVRKRLLFETYENADLYKKLKINSSLILPDNYAEACEILDRIEELKSPMEKLNSFSSCISCIQSSVLEISKGEIEISNTEDEVKVLVYILLRSQLNNPAAEIELIKDYLGLRVEQRTLNSFAEAINYIVNDLDI